MERPWMLGEQQEQRGSTRGAVTSPSPLHALSQLRLWDGNLWFWPLGGDMARSATEEKHLLLGCWGCSRWSDVVHEAMVCLSIIVTSPCLRKEGTICLSPACLCVPVSGTWQWFFALPAGHARYIVGCSMQSSFNPDPSPQERGWEAILKKSHWMTGWAGLVFSPPPFIVLSMSPELWCEQTGRDFTGF